MANNQIKFGIGFNVDKTGLNQLKQEIQQIKNLTADDLIKINNGKLQNADKELQEIQNSAKKLEGALERAFNTNLGTLNVSKFNQELKNLNLNKIYSDFSKAGAAGQNAFRNVATQVLTTNMQLKQTHSLLDSMATTMANTVKWGVASSVMNTFTGSVQKAYGYVKDLDTSLNDIRIVTEKSSEEMAKFAVQANNAAKQLGQSTTAYTDAALIYYQQGLGNEDVTARAETTLKAANVTGQAGAEVSEQLTAVWNGYKVSAQETELYVDKLAAVAATTASDLEELSTGMSKVASAASSMGVDIDQLNGHLATVISVTRQAPESVGTAFKTIYARLGDLAVGGEDEFGTKLGEVSGKLKQMGVEIMDSQGQMRDMGTVMEEVAEKWNGWTDAQKQAAAVAMAGKRQYNNLIALFDNWDMYEDAVATSANAMGTLEKQQDIYMESTAAHLKALKASAEDLYDSLLDPKGLNPVIDSLKLVVDFSGNFIDAIGGSSGALLALGTIGTRVFSKQIAGGLATTITNLIATKENIQKINAEAEILKQFDNLKIEDSRTQNLIAMKQQVLDLNKAITNEERNIANEFITQTNELYKEKDALEESLNKAKELHTTLTGEKINTYSKESRDDLRKGLEDEQKDFKNYANGIKELERHEATYKTSKGKDKEVLSKYRDELKGQIEISKELIKYNKLDEESRQKLVEAINHYNKVTNNGKKYDFNNIKVRNAQIQVQEAYKEAILKTNQSLTNSINALQRYDKAIENNIEKTKQAEITFKSWIQQIDLRNKIQQFTTFIGKIGQLASGLNTLANIPSIWNNDDLSVGEKTLQIITNLSFAIPMVISGFGALIPVATKTISILKSFYTLSANKAYINILKKEAIARGVHWTSIDRETRSKIRLEKVTLKNIAAEGKEVLMKKLQTSATWKLITAEKTLMGVTAPLWKLLAGGIAIAAAVSLGIYAIVKAQNANKEALESATASMERQNKILTKLQEEHKALQEQIEGYEEAYNKVANMTEAMEGYSTAVEESNQKARELIETLGLYGEWDYSKNGLIEIDEDAVQEAYDKKLAEVYKAEVRSELSKYNVNQAEWNLLREKDAFNTVNLDVQKTEPKSESVLENKNENMFLLGSISEEIYSNIKNLSSASKGVEYFNDLEEIADKANLSESQVSALAQVIKDLGEKADSTRSDIMQLTEEESYRLQQSGKAIAKAQGLYLDSEAAQSAYGNLIAQDEEYKKVAERNAELTNKDVDNAQIKWLLRQQEDGKTWGITINDEELSRYYAKYVAGWSEEEIKKATYEGGKGKGTLTRADGEVLDLVDEESRKDLYAALLSNKLIESSVAQDNNIKELIDTITSISEKGVKNPSYLGDTVATQEALLTALSNYDIESEKALDLDFSLIHPDDINTLKEEIKDIGGKLGQKVLEGLDKYDPDKHGELYGERLNEAQDQNIDTQITAEGLDSAAIETQTELIQDNVEALEDNDNAAKQLAVNNTLMNQGMENLIDNWEDWSKVLKSGNKTTSEYAKTIKAISSSIEDLVGLSEGMGENLSSSFFDSAENLALLERAANADAEAVEELGYAVATDLIDNIEYDRMGFSDALDKMRSEIEDFEGIDLGENGWISTGEEMETAFNIAKQNILNGINEIKTSSMSIGDSLANAIGEDDTAAFVNSLNAMAIATQMSVAEMQGLLNSMGIQATVTTTKVPTMQAVPVMKTVENIESEDPLIKTTKTWQTDTEYYAGYLDVAQVSYNGNTPGAAPITKIGHGAPTQSNVTKAAPSGGGGGSNSKPKKSYKTTEKERDPFHNVNNKLKKYATQYDRLADAQERLYGDDLRKNLESQLNIIKKQVSATKEKLAIAKQEAKEMRKSTENQRKGYYNDLKDFGIKFNDNGTIKNYNSVMKEWDNKVKELHDKWNSLTAKQQESDAGQALEKQIEKAETNRDMLVQLIEDYDTLIYETIPELQDEITQFAYQQIEIQLAKFKLDAELKLDLDEAIKQWEDFKKELTELKLFEDLGASDSLSAEAAKLLEIQDLTKDTVEERVNSELIKTLTKDVAKLEKEKEDIENNPKTYDGQFAARDEDGNILKDSKGNVIIDKVALDEAIKESEEALREAILDLENAQKEALENVLRGIELIGESYDKELELLEFIDNQTQHEMDMINLVFGDKAYEKMADMYEIMAINAERVVAARREEMNYYYEQMNRTDITEEEREKWKELYMESVEDFQTALNERANIIKEEFSNYLQAELKTVNDFLDFDNSKATWELEMEIEDDYLDEIDAAFGKQSFINKVQDSINNTDSLSAQKKLNDMLDDELAKLKEKDKLTKYDLDRANAMFELELKKIALEEAQQNKSQMRLRRDASGNYSYQFVADESSEAKAREELLQAQNDLRALDKEKLQEVSNELLEIQEQINQTLVDYYSLSEEEQEAQREAFEKQMEYLSRRQQELAEEAKDVQFNLGESTFIAMKGLYDADEENFANLSEAKKEILRQENLDFAELAAEQQSILIYDMLPDWAHSLDEMIEKVSNPNSGYAAVYEQAMSNINEKNKEVQNSLKDILKDSTETYGTAIEGANGWYNEQQKVTDSLKNTYEALKDIFEEMSKILKTIEKTTNTYIKTEDFDRGYIEAPAARKSGNSSAFSKEAKDRLSSAIAKMTAGVAAQMFLDRELATKLEAIVDNYTNVPPASFGTGGYTGEWGSDGKLAILHEKELVLNKDDTINLLDLIEEIRHIKSAEDNNTILSLMNLIKNQQGSAFSINYEELMGDMANKNKQYDVLQTHIENSISKINSFINRVTENSIESINKLLTQASEAKVDDKAIEQNVEIYADFPNANDTQQIKEAFLGLTNAAAQYAFKNKR